MTAHRPNRGRRLAAHGTLDCLSISRSHLSLKYKQAQQMRKHKRANELYLQLRSITNKLLRAA